MPTNNIIVLDSFFNLTNKSNLIESLIRFNTIFWTFGSGLLFWGHPVYTCLSLYVWNGWWARSLTKRCNKMPEQRRWQNAKLLWLLLLSTGGRDVEAAAAGDDAAVDGRERSVGRSVGAVVAAAPLMSRHRPTIVPRRSTGADGRRPREHRPPGEPLDGGGGGGADRRKGSRTLWAVLTVSRRRTPWAIERTLNRAF